jgi:ataxia telangiectasia mutated family protein
MIRSSNSQVKGRDGLKTARGQAKKWFELDDREYRRLRDSRQAFLKQSLENYLLSLKACDAYDSDALRFSALWLEHSENEIANAAVQKHLSSVASCKFATLMNQWTSRLLDQANGFQKLLSSLVLRICIDHPYHGMYQIFASSKTRSNKDPVAIARNTAAVTVVNQLKGNKKVGHIWLAVHNSNVAFVKFAGDKLDDSKIKPGSKVSLRKSAAGLRLEQDVLNLKVPPPTMDIPLRADCNYQDIPTLLKFQSEFSIASGISMPKILTATATDGKKYKQLVRTSIQFQISLTFRQFKSGNDDLRQDAIMEQVFTQVSNLLRSHRDTRQRHLGIRTYKVLPLTAAAGIIEFVSNTIPLHDYLMPAHVEYFPSDMKQTVCRQQISDAGSKSVDQRIKVFKAVCEKFHPVLRFFFMERFENPDDWFQNRLNYTRSTAAISILGHILGLGDRHGHNILLDEQTGEVVHIDLGIAFEQGRVLPVPELVPFRLTRDLVDGMGITKTEGVFRRCCEFTLEALRNESYSIMTILDVLRYDPLYSWSLSPLRLQKLQERQTDAALEKVPMNEDILKADKKENEPGEADRALTVVGKKLSKSLSVTATVNELIQQATDEKNLALLYCGWAAYA